MNIEYTVDNFRSTFWTPFEQYNERIGQTFKVLGRHTEAEAELEAAGTPDTMYRIRFADGVEISAWGEEVCQ